jgi:phage tail-like protein
MSQMSEFSNTDYLYAHLPGRMRRDDPGFFLKRFLSVVGTELDGFDLTIDTFYQLINPDTAPIEFIDFWLDALFGWGWFPTWFTVARRRAFYAAITRHYAKRGTLEGIKEFLAAFGLRVIVEAAPQFLDEVALGEDVWSVSGPLGILIRAFPEAPAVNEDLSFLDEATLDEDVGAEPMESIQRADLDELLRYVQPLGNIIMIENLGFPGPRVPAPPLDYGYGEYGEAGYG